jgi:hypothetical protein
MSSGPRLFGGRYSEWTNGTYKVLTVGSPSEEDEMSGAEDGRVITAPLPKRLNTLVGVAPPSTPPPSSPEASAPPPSSREVDEGVQPEPRTVKKAVPIRSHPVFDKLLNALNYERPYVPEQKAETNGDPAAAHSVGPRLLAVGVDTPPLEPRTKLSDSLVRDLIPKPLEAPARDVPTVVTRSMPSKAADEPVASAPRRTRRPLLVVGALSIAVGIGGVLFFVLGSSKTPVPDQPVLVAQPPSTTSEVAPTIPPPPPPAESTTALAAAPIATPTTPVLSSPPTSSALHRSNVSGPPHGEPGARAAHGRDGAPAGTRPTTNPSASSGPPVDQRGAQKYKPEE